ncbi:MAG: tol-pal system protein YbgF [Candidatus Methylomirabilales bacterium]
MKEIKAQYLTWPLLVSVGILSTGCVVSADRFDALQHDVRRLRVDVNTNQERLQKVDPTGGEGGQPTDAVTRVEELAAETRMVQGKLEENSYQLAEMSQRLDEAEALLRGETPGAGGTSRVRQAPPQSTTPPPPVPVGAPQVPAGETSGTGQPLPPRGGGVSSLPPSATATAPTPPVMQGSLPSPEEVYRNALTDYTKGNYDLAIEGFKNYLTFFPKTSLVPNAQYWLGESYYSKREYLRAIREFDKLIKGHPSSTKVPSAMLKKGYAYVELGETRQGEGVLRELVGKFPRSREARLAQDSLERLQ